MSEVDGAGRRALTALDPARVPVVVAAGQVTACGTVAAATVVYNGTEAASVPVYVTLDDGCRAVANALEAHGPAGEVLVGLRVKLLPGHRFEFTG